MTLPDIDTLATFGGQLNDYSPVVDPTTDRPAAGTNQAYSSIAMVTHTAPRAWCRFVTSATTPALATNNGHDAMWGSSSGVKPTLLRNSIGNYSVTWPLTVTDEMGVSHTVNLRAVKVSSEGPTNGFITATVSGNIVTVLTFSASNSANDLGGNTTIYVEVV